MGRILETDTYLHMEHMFYVCCAADVGKGVLTLMIHCWGAGKQVDIWGGMQVSGRENLRHPPPPLSTLEMQKKATGSLRLSGERIMKLAEELYQTGFISYPRTETDSFDPSYDILVTSAPHLLIRVS